MEEWKYETVATQRCSHVKDYVILETNNQVRRCKIWTVLKDDVNCGYVNVAYRFGQSSPKVFSSDLVRKCEVFETLNMLFSPKTTTFKCPQGRQWRSKKVWSWWISVYHLPGFIAGAWRCNDVPGWAGGFPKADLHHVSSSGQELGEFSIKSQAYNVCNSPQNCQSWVGFADAWKSVRAKLKVTNIIFDLCLALSGNVFQHPLDLFWLSPGRCPLSVHHHAGCSALNTIHISINDVLVISWPFCSQSLCTRHGERRFLSIIQCTVMWITSS